MAKDPAFLFYYQDFLVGTDYMDNEAVGAYIRCLCHQAHKGSISEAHMKKICFSSEIHSAIKNKFKTEDNGKTFFNERLKAELEKRRSYSESRANNRKGKKKTSPSSYNISKTYDIHMENENVNEDEKRKGGVGEKQEVIFPFDSENFLTLWGHWKQYKAKEYGFKFKSPQSEQAAMAKLANMSNGDEATALAIITQSIENGWKGFFELKQNTNGKRTSLESRLERANELIDQMYGQ